MKFKLFLFSLASLVILGLSVASTALALDPSSISVNIAPENPAPFQNTAITLSSFSANLDSVSISWFVNNKNTLSGIGKKSFLLNAPAAGAETAVLVKIFLPDGEIDKTITIRPSVMVLLWQANDSYAPPFYKGKALPVADSEVKVVAMPEIMNSRGSLIDPRNMTYAWKKDYNNMPDDSGYGKNFFLYTNDYLENGNNVGVVAETTDQQYSSEGSIDVGMTTAQISFYKRDALLGTIWENALADGHQIKDNEIVVATPYFISPKEILNPALTWNWSINDTLIPITNFIGNTISLKAQAGISGTSKLSLEINNNYKIFQTASKSININF